ncbi:MAG: PD-(D/E)XK nuclease family protein [Thermoleophilia bacterium]
MAFRIDPYPQFAWSMTRQRLLEKCPRAYYLRYYLSHNGWLDDAHERSRVAYHLGKLVSLDTIFGHEMDERAREIERCVRAGHPPPSAAELEETTRRTLRAAWRSSRDERAAFERSPKRTVMLRSFYLEDAPPDRREIDRINEKIPTCTANLLAVADWEVVAECGSDGCVVIPDFAHFFLGGVKIFAAPDLVYVAEGRLHVIDWKSGRRSDDDDVQVLLSAYCVGLENPDAELRPVLHYLLADDSVTPDIPGDLEGFVAETVEPGLKAMRDLLQDPMENAPLPEGEFPRRESGLCSHCNFSRLCEGV